MTALTPLCRPPDSTALQVTVPTAAVTAGPLRGSPASTGHPAPRSQSDHTSSTSDPSWLFALGGLPAVTHALPGWPPLPPPPRAGASAPAVPASGLHRPSGVHRHLLGEAVPPSRQACWSRKSRSRGCCPPPAACCPRLLRGADPSAPAGSRPPPCGCTYLAVVGACVPEPPAQAANAVQHQAPDQVVLQGPVGGRGAGRGQASAVCSPSRGVRVVGKTSRTAPTHAPRYSAPPTREVPLRKGSRGR